VDQESGVAFVMVQLKGLLADDDRLSDGLFIRSSNRKYREISGLRHVARGMHYEILVWKCVGVEACRQHKVIPDRSFL
jgi:hypothetical protein